MNDRESGRRLIQTLVARFKENYDEYTRTGSKYNETQLRNDFLNPFLEALGWDVFNKKVASQHLREVVQEDTVEIDDTSRYARKKPDYALRVNGERKFFVEAKKPAVSVETDGEAAFQLRRYGWNARLAISVLTNFDKLAIYDCRPRPSPSDNVKIARLKIYNYTEYLTKFDEIYDQLSREVVYSGRFDQIFTLDERLIGTELFDQYFLDQIEKWRKHLAESLVRYNPRLSQEELNFLVQRLINRIIFLRICEDREIEKYEELLGVKTYEDLKLLFRRADERYNSSLFDFIEDKLSLSIQLSSDVLVAIFKELYYPQSPYVFSVVETGILGEIYEMFLAKEICLDEDGVKIVEKPEIREAGGVVPTPRCIVDAIIQRSLAPLCQGKSPIELSSLRIADIACGSGIFLLAAYEYLLNYHLEWYVNDGVAKHGEKVYMSLNGEWNLTLYEKQRILLNNIYGVDIDIQAVEVTRFSLLLKILEKEGIAAINAHLSKYNMRALPNLNENIQCGNSLVDSNYFDYDKAEFTSEEQLTKINPFDWVDSFRSIMKDKGFDVIIGNPPYTRIQNLVKYLPEEADYYKSNVAPYTSAKSDNFDKYFLFIERALSSLLKPTGNSGYIVPHKFFTIKSGKALRKLISSGNHLTNIVHFGVQQVFGKRTTTYTCILILSRAGSKHFTVEHINNLTAWCHGENGIVEMHAADEIDEAPWVFISPQAKHLFERLRIENPTTLTQVASIFVGVQTSADKIYIIQPISETAEIVKFNDNDGTSQAIEKAILRPCLLDVELVAFGKPEFNTYIIFPYKIINEKDKQKAKLYSESEMQENFPLCWKYLNTHKEYLLKRNIQNYTEDTWYRYGRSQSLTKFNGEPKLIWPVLSLESRYAYDDQNIVFTGGGNGPYYALRPRSESSLSIYYIQAILSHPVIEAMVMARASKFRGGYGSHGKQFIEYIPIREINFDNLADVEAYEGVVRYVEQLITATDNAIKATIPHKKELFLRQGMRLKRKIDHLIEQLYHISDTDLKVTGELTNNFQVRD